MPVRTYLDYDSLGRVLHRAQCVWQNCGTYGSTPGWWIVANTYDLAGDLTSYTDAFGHTLTQTFDTVGRPLNLTSSWIDANHPATLITVDAAAGYYPSGALHKALFANGLTETTAYNNRLQPCRINWNSSAAILSQCADALPSGNFLDFTYGFNAGTANNGNIITWNATGQQIFNRSFSYDTLNRIAAMQHSAPLPKSCLPSSATITWTIDPWGNRTDQSPSAGTCSFHQSVNAQNQLIGSGYQYDAAGNMTYDGSHRYFYDAENHLTQVDGFGTCSTATACYLYNTEGQRVYKYMGAGSNTTSYIYGSGGEVVADADTNRNWHQTYLRFGGKLTSLYVGSGTFFYHLDHLGSTRLGTDMTRNVTENMDFLPFGEQIAGGSTTSRKFTGKERDGESNLDNFGARYNSSILGRFMSPDEPLMDQETSSPQSWNLYTYVRNNPINNTDPSGNACVQDGKGGWIDDGSGGQPCAQAAEPQKVEVKADAPPSADDERIRDFARQLNQYNVINNTLKMAGAGAVIGATGGTACYYLCSTATVTTLGAAGTAGATAAPILYKTGDVIDEVVETSAGPVRIYGEVVVEGTQVTIKNVLVYPADSAQKLNVGTREMLKAIRPLFDGLKQAGYTTVRIVGDRVSGANPGRTVDITKTLR